MTPAQVSIYGIATAYPPHRIRQDDVMAKAGEVFGHRPELMQRMSKSYGNAGVRQRYSCVPLEWYAGQHGWPERAQLFEENAVRLLTQAGRDALERASIKPGAVAATVTVSSTGIVTPCLDSLLQGPLGLSPAVLRLPVFGLGCAGGAIGLARAAAMARAHAGQWILFMCAELCGLTFRRADDSKANIIGTTIFGDGAAAVVLRATGADGAESTQAPSLARVTAWGEHTWPGTRDMMGWRVEDDGLAVQFSNSIPALVREKMRGVTDGFLAAHGLAQGDLAGMIVHPGGTKVLEALEACYDLPQGALADARAILAEYGNMSAVTVLAVLDRALARGASGRQLMTAMGPGFSVGLCLLDLP